jgi:AraC family transcriptional regulator, arabinose operon regulatory protein
MDPRITWAIEEIDRRLGEPTRVGDMAAAVNLSPSRFSHMFREAMGISPMRYLQAKRMEHARVLLETTSLSVKEVMARVGCSDPSHFSRDFRRYHGTPPSAWRTSSRFRPRDRTPRAQSIAPERVTAA